MTSIYWIETSGPGRLGIMPRPRGGDWLSDEIKGFRSQRVDVLVCALSQPEIEDLDLADECDLCRAHGIDFIQFPLIDRSIPSLESGGQLIMNIKSLIEQGKSVVVHCRLGIGRSGMICTGVLIAMGDELLGALERVSLARGMNVPDTDEQLRWLADFKRRLAQNPSFGPNQA